MISIDKWSVTSIESYRDGGTLHITTDCGDYWLNHRIDCGDNRGKIYTEHPTDSSIPLDNSQINVLELLSAVAAYGSGAEFDLGTMPQEIERLKLEILKHGNTIRQYHAEFQKLQNFCKINHLGIDGQSVADILMDKIVNLDSHTPGQIRNGPAIKKIQYPDYGFVN